MEHNYRGDTFWRSYEVEYEDKPYKFQPDDVLKIAFYNFNGEEFLPKEIVINEETSKVDVMWQKEEMATLNDRQYILEVEVTTNLFRKTHQELVDLSQDYIIHGEEGER